SVTLAVAARCAGAGRPPSAAVFDLNGDGKSDIVIRNPATGVNRVMFMNGTAVSSESPLPSMTDRDFEMAALADFSLAARADLLWYHQSSGERLAWFMNGVSIASTLALGQQVDTDWHIAGAAQLGGGARAHVVGRRE